jgi:glycosyltransferase involved in cell wall biosynthesis
MTLNASTSAELSPRLPTLSVVMPNYNHARYLEAALQAHLNQTTAPLEIIVVDDASTDDSRALVERAAGAHPRLRLIALPRNGGVVRAMNRGLREARGDYVCFSAADDLVTPDFSAWSLEVLAGHPTAGFCFSDLAVLDGDSGSVRRVPLFLSDRPCMFSPREMERALTRLHYALPSHTILYRRDALLAVGGFMEELRWLADWFANYVLAFRHGACYVPEVLAYCRASPHSYSGRGSRQGSLQRDLVYRVLDLLASDGYRDVARAFRDSATVPEVRLRMLPWLLGSPCHRPYLTPRLMARLLGRGTWSLLVPYLPAVVPGALGGLASAARRRRLANGRAPRAGGG